MPVQKLTQISAELCCSRQLRTQRTDTKHTTRLHVYVVRQNGRRKSRMRSSQHKNDLTVPTNSAIGPSPAVQRRTATSKNPTTCTLPSDVISHNSIHHSAVVCQAPLCSVHRYATLSVINARALCEVSYRTNMTQSSSSTHHSCHIHISSSNSYHVISQLFVLQCLVSHLMHKNTHVTDICLHLFSLSSCI